MDTKLQLTVSISIENTNKIAHSNLKNLAVSVNEILDEGFIDPLGKTEIQSVEKATKAVSHLPNPFRVNLTFETAILLRYTFVENTRLNVVVNNHQNEQTFDCLFQTDISLAGILSSAPHSTLSLPLANYPGTTLTLSAEPLSENKSLYELKLSCKDVKDIEWWSKSDPFLKILKPKTRQENGYSFEPDCINSIEWVKVIETEHKQDDLNPVFENIKVGGDKLCFDDDTLPLKIEIWDYSKDGDLEKTKIGTALFCLKDILSGEKTELRATDQLGQNAGRIIFDNIEKKPCYSFLDYLNGGLCLQQTVLVDFTSSNGPLSSPLSLHHLSPSSPSMYEQALGEVCPVLLNYDRDSQVPVYGMGAKFTKFGVEDVKDFFYVQTQRLAIARSVPDILEMYESACKVVDLAGPCKLAPAIQRMTDWANKMAEKDPFFYSVLTVFTDGEVSDMDQTIHALVEASNSPLSVLLIGLTAPNSQNTFEDLQTLDSDSFRLKSPITKKTALRDITHFVSYSSHKNDHKVLAKKILEELPFQIVEYFQMKNIQPCGKRS